MEASCAGCGSREELTNSVKMNGIKQPRFCKECFMKVFRARTDVGITQDDYYIKQLIETNELESLALFLKGG